MARSGAVLDAARVGRAGPGEPSRESFSTPLERDATCEVAIVGAGPGGLAAAVLLAARGLKVRVFESQDRIGGRCSRVWLGDAADTSRQYAFDRGPTFFLMPYVLDEVFAAAGRRLADEVELRRLDPMYRLVIGQGSASGGGGSKPVIVDATQDIEEMSRRLGAISPRDGARFASFIADNRYKLRHSESILRNPMRSPLDLFSRETWLDTLKVGPVLRPHMSVHDLLAKYFKDDRVKLAVSFQSKYLGMSPYDCPSLFTILPFIEYEYGVWHPVGGCNALMEALARVAVQMGVRIHLSSPVESLEFQGKRARAVVCRRTDGAGGQQEGDRVRIACEHVVMNADATWAIKKLIPESIRGKDTDASIDARKYSCSTAMLYLGVRGKVNLPHHTIYVSSRYRDNLSEISSLGTLSEDPSIYVCNPCTTDPGMAPDGDSALYVLMPTPSERVSGSGPGSKVDWQGRRSQVREAMLSQISRVLGEQDAGLRELSSRIVVEEMLTPPDWRGMNINFGATFNLAHNLGQMLHKRPQNKLPYADNLYLVGGGTHPGSGLPTIFLSAQITSRLLCEGQPESAGRGPGAGIAVGAGAAGGA
ncbi:MAG: phytoene desaturase family protein [Planctomycetota bacterium]|nr:phytoene desaturase family protein [Planctomycetota bacterium]